MPVRYQVVIDCADPARLARFWAEALGYVPEPPPARYPTWAAYWRQAGVPEEELAEVGEGIMDPDGAGPHLWFQIVPERKTVKNRLHFDLHATGGLHATAGRAVPLETRREQVEAEAARLVAAGATRVRALHEEGVDHYAVNMLDPEGNEFDIN